MTLSLSLKVNTSTTWMLPSSVASSSCSESVLRQTAVMLDSLLKHTHTHRAHTNVNRNIVSQISWAICKSAPRSGRVTTPAPHHSVFYRPNALLPPNQQRQSTEGSVYARKIISVQLVCRPSQLCYHIFTCFLFKKNRERHGASK